MSFVTDYEHGMAMTRLAKKYGLTRKKAKAKLVAMGLWVKRPKELVQIMVSRKMSFKEITEALNITYTYAYRLPKILPAVVSNQGKPLPDGEWSRLMFGGVYCQSSPAGHVFIPHLDDPDPTRYTIYAYPPLKDQKQGSLQNAAE